MSDIKNAQVKMIEAELSRHFEYMFMLLDGCEDTMELRNAMAYLIAASFSTMEILISEHQEDLDIEILTRAIHKMSADAINSLTINLEMSRLGGKDHLN